MRNQQGSETAFVCFTALGTPGTEVGRYQKNKTEGENTFTAANLQATKALTPLLPPSSERDWLLQGLQELILAMTDKTQASKTLGENSFIESDVKKTHTN